MATRSVKLLNALSALPVWATYCCSKKATLGVYIYLTEILDMFQDIGLSLLSGLTAYSSDISTM
jgi:hypothetical protein